MIIELAGEPFKRTLASEMAVIYPFFVVYLLYFILEILSFHHNH